MMIGCLSGSGRGTPIDGTYTFCVPGRTTPLAPDLVTDGPPATGPLGFGVGSLTDGDIVTQVGWRAATVGEVGVDIVLQLGQGCFVDRVLLHQATTETQAPAPAAAVGADGIESIGHVEPAGLSRVEVFAAAEGQPLALVGHAGERGTATFADGPITVCVGVDAQELIVRLISHQRDIRVSGLEVWGAAPGEPRVFPVPATMDLLPGPGLIVDADCTVAIAPLATDDARFAADLLAEKLGERTGRTPEVSEDGNVTADHVLVLGPPMTGPPTAPEPVADAEAFSLRVESGGATIAAGDRRGLVYGVEALLQLAEATGKATDEGATIPACTIEDAPRLPFRGVHLFLPARDQIDYAKRLIRYLLVPMRLNTIFLELAGAMQFDRRPEIAQAWERQNRLAAEGKAPPVPHGGVSGGGCLTKAEVKDLVDYARAYGIEVIPEIQSFSHVQYLTMTYPGIAEAPGADGYPDSYCPLHPESHRIVFDMIDEVVELLGPLRYLHMGHDEIYTMAECPRCKDKTRDELFAHDVHEIHAYLKKKGVGMMIWADMLQPWQRYAGDNAATMIPTDIIMLEFVWYFRTWADTEDHLLDHGFQVILGNCYSSHFTRYEHRATKPGVIGTQVSVWSDTSEEEMGRLGKLYDLAYSANTAWTGHCQEELRWTFDRRIADLLPGIRAQLRGAERRSSAGPIRARALDLSAHHTAPLRDPRGRYGAYDLTSLPIGQMQWRGLPFRFGEGGIVVEPGQARGGSCPEAVTIPIDGMAPSVVFAHTAIGVGRIPDPFGPRQVIARYHVEFADGTRDTVEVAFGHHLAEWNRRHGAPMGPTFHRHAGYVATYPVDPVWQGKTANGEDVTVYACEWTNPHPERALRAIRIATADVDAEVALMVLAMTVVE